MNQTRSLHCSHFCQPVSKRKRYHTLQHYTAQHNFHVPIVDGPKQNRMNFQTQMNTILSIKECVQLSSVIRK